MRADESGRGPIVCLVTDRRRLCAACDPRQALDCLVAQAREAVAAGVDLLQIREPDLEAAPLTALAARVVEIARGTATRVVVNDRLDVAIAAGRSVHSVDEARTARAADYLIAGTVFPSASKPEVSRSLGESGLAAVARAVETPILAIGGVALDTVARVAAAGAAGFAAIGFFLGGGAPCRAAPLGSLVAEARARFDSVKTAP